MDITVYLPDELGKRAKELELPLSRMLRDAVTEELDRRDTVSKTLSEPETFGLNLEDPEDGKHYTGRFTGTQIAEHVYLTDDKRVIVYDENKLNYWIAEDPETDLRDMLDDAEYVEALAGLGLRAVIDL